MLEGLDYSVRISGRARYARIVVRPDMSVEVVLPQGVHAIHAATLLREKESWLARTLNRFRVHAPLEQVGGQNSKPEQISFESLGLGFSTIYHRTDSLQVRVSGRGSELRLTGCVDDVVKLKAALQRWLKRKGNELLLPVLEAESERLGLNYHQAVIRLQKRCWGSCSRNKTISLNARLLFLPHPLMRYVMVHELAHLEEMNHSPAFWALVERCDRNWLEHRRQLKQASRRIPAWTER
ncbi:MAG: SprT family zinc-dependent metalloprotease [Mariprofundaceae bacterium]|nr:SprT family zinc-dependent metalloprotease [Mariprofundaceae bacterium]